MPFHKFYYHVVWATKYRQDLITLELEPTLFAFLSNKSASINSPILAINAVPDHIHIAVSVPPSLAFGDWVKRVKGASSYELNQHFPNLEPSFRWQSGYGALTFGEKRLPFVRDYIEKQKIHHQHNTIHPYLEKID